MACKVWKMSKSYISNHCTKRLHMLKSLVQTLLNDCFKRTLNFKKIYCVLGIYLLLNSYSFLFHLFFLLCSVFHQALITILHSTLFSNFSRGFMHIYFLQLDRKTWNQYRFITHPAHDLISSCDGWPLWNTAERAKLENVHSKAPDFSSACYTCNFCCCTILSFSWITENFGFSWLEVMRFITVNFFLPLYFSSWIR